MTAKNPVVFVVDDDEAVRKGLENLEKHIENMKKFELEAIVAINHFITDSDEEIEVV